MSVILEKMPTKLCTFASSSCPMRSCAIHILFLMYIGDRVAHDDGRDLYFCDL